MRLSKTILVASIWRRISFCIQRRLQNISWRRGTRIIHLSSYPWCSHVCWIDDACRFHRYHQEMVIQAYKTVKTQNSSILKNMLFDENNHYLGDTKKNWCTEIRIEILCTIILNGLYQTRPNMLLQMYHQMTSLTIAPPKTTSNWLHQSVKVRQLSLIFHNN